MQEKQVTLGAHSLGHRATQVPSARSVLFIASREGRRPGYMKPPPRKAAPLPAGRERTGFPCPPGCLRASFAGFAASREPGRRRETNLLELQEAQTETPKPRSRPMPGA